MPGNRGKEEASRIISFASIVLGITILDQFTKFLALRFLPPDASVPVFHPVFHLTLVHNPGIAFGLFRRYEIVLQFLISASILFLIVLSAKMCALHAKPTPDSRFLDLTQWSFALILGGALGNWLDRIRYKAVVDFLDFRIWPVFNIADIAITTGVGLYLFVFLRRRKSGL